MALSITNTTNADGETVVCAVGEVDVSCASELREAIDAALEAGSAAVVVDLAEVPYIDSTGIGVLVGAVHRAHEASAEVRVTNPQRNVARVLGLLGVDRELGLGD